MYVFIPIYLPTSIVYYYLSYRVYAMASMICAQYYCLGYRISHDHYEQWSLLLLLLTELQDKP